nr:MAG TPA: hypothetical protein [Caudoviricetes sp.]
MTQTKRTIMMSKNEDYPLVQAFINALNAKSQGEVEKQAEIMYDQVFRNRYSGRDGHETNRP